MRRRWAVAVLLLLGWAAVVHAAGPLFLRAPGEPFLWADGGNGIPFNPDRGRLGPLVNALAVAILEGGLAQWTAVPTSTVSFHNAGPLPVDVNLNNVGPYLMPLAPDGLNAVVFDETGEIFLAIFGSRSGVLGFASPEWLDLDTGEILEGVGFFNGGAFLSGFPTTETESLFVHEFGHYLNLGHSAVNGQVAAFNDHSGPTPNDTFPLENLFGRIETMYPFIFIGGGQASPHVDDAAAVSTLYPAADFYTTRGSISGTLFFADGMTRASGSNLIARNINDPFDDAVSSIAGDFGTSFSQSDPFSGRYRFNGLTPGADYAFFVDQIVAGVFSIPIRLPLPGPEEFYNGDDESHDGSLDVPAEFTPVRATAGVPVEGADIIFNSIAPGPIPLGDDDFAEIILPFAFSFCGVEHRSVFVSSNGMLTFGSGSAAFLEDSGFLLSSIPRIACMWDDLNPSTGGLVSFALTPETLTVRWDEIPEFFSLGANTFEATLHKSSNQVDITFGDLSAVDGLVGYSCGGLQTLGIEEETDLSSFGKSTFNGRNLAAAYEWFTNDNDMSGASFSFSSPNVFKDLFEPNDSITQSKRIQVPFDTAAHFTDMHQGGDVDYYRIRMAANTTLVVETKPGHPLDTMIGLFDVATGEMVAFDDDLGVGSLSKAVLPVERAGLYAAAVTTFPDFDFQGTGEGAGRYLLDVRVVDGIVLPLLDDNSVEIELGFEFPFQEQVWSSVWVNSNGNLTFGVGDNDFSETLAEFLAGPPRIAGLWDDLSPNNGGMVTIKRAEGRIELRWIEVPEFFSTGANTFTITLFADGDIEIAYGTLNGNDGLVGITAGGGVPIVVDVDLSEAEVFPNLGTVYQQFGNGALDLEGHTLRFSGN